MARRRTISRTKYKNKNLNKINKKAEGSSSTAA
jgi:hypothetical protein